MLSVQNVSKYFAFIPAVKNVSLDIAPGEIVGFLGPNGAGKTTLMRLITGYLAPTRGSISIAGIPLDKDPLAARRAIGYLPETPPLYQDMTVRDYLTFAARLRDIPKKHINAAVDTALEQCHIIDVQSRIIATLSKGYKQRVGIAQAIIHNPKILILDEPTNGLDPAQVIQVRQLIRNLEGTRTVMISTHILSEIEQLAHRVVVIHKGIILADGPLEKFLNHPETGTKQSLEKTFISLTA